jgi:hypothetical protein
MQTMEELTMTALSLVFLLLGVVLIASIVMSAFNPYEQIAIGNTRKLAAVMNQACVSEGSTPINIDFDLPQNVPIGSNILTMLPKWLMRNFGDPNFVLYYESYPPGEAIGWETYNDMDSRLYIILPNSVRPYGSWGIEDVKEYANTKVKNFEDQNKIKLQGYVIANIMLNGEYSGMVTMREDKTKQQVMNVTGKDYGQGGASGGAGAGGDWGGPAVFFSFGSWDSAKSKGKPAEPTEEDFFRFKNYNSLTLTEKTMVKYESCGPYSLCLKTRSGVYRFPLENCKAHDIKTVQFVYDARNRAGVTIGNLAVVAAAFALAKSSLVGALWKFASFVPLSRITIIGYTVTKAEEFVAWSATATFGVKRSDFSLASPCQIKQAEVLVTSCTKASIKGSLLDSNPCPTYISYPIYGLGDKEIFSQIGTHYECAEKITVKPDNKRIDKTTYSLITHLTETDKCVQFKIFEPVTGFCWTPDSYMNNADSLDGLITWISGLPQELIGSIIDTHPVREAVAYSELSDDISLLPTKSEALNSWMNSFDRKVSWGWPNAGTSALAALGMTAWEKA